MADIQPQLNQIWTNQWYPAMITSLTSIGGVGPVDAQGNTLPNLSAIDTLAIVGLVTPAMISAIDRFNSQANSTMIGRTASGAAVRSDFVDSDGVLLDGDLYAADVATGGDQAPPPQPTFVDAKTYLSYMPDPLSLGMSVSDSYKRYPVTTTDDALTQFDAYAQLTFEPYVGERRFLTDQLKVTLQFLRQSIDDYQSLVNASAAALYAGSADTTRPISADLLTSFFSALRAVCNDFDVLNENPPSMESLADAVRAALAASSKFVGEALAKISEEVGKNAGIIGKNISTGFLENAGFLSFVVVGIVIHLYLH